MGAKPAGGPLSPAEEALWLLQRLVPDHGIANVAMRIDPRGPVRWWPMREALRWLVARHAALRSCFPLANGAPLRVVRAADEVEVELELLDALPDGVTEVEAVLRPFAARPFDVEAAPLVRLGMVGTGSGGHVLCLVTHHLVVDGASLAVMVGELDAAYRSFASTGAAPDLPEPAAVEPVWPREDSLRYWRGRLAGYTPAGMRLEPGREIGPVPTFDAGHVSIAYPQRSTAAVAELRSRSRGTDGAVLLAAYLLALRAQGAADDALVGVMVNTRGPAEARSVGLHVVTLPVRIAIDPDRTFTDLVGTVASTLMADMEHADVPFEMVAPELVSPTDDRLWWRSGLVRHLFNYRLPTATAAGTGGPQVRDLSTGLSRFDLELTVERHAGTYYADLIYSTEVHDAAFAESVLRRIGIAIDLARADPQRRIGEFDLRTPDEVRLLEEVNNTTARFAGPQTVPELVAASAAAAPDAPAVVDGDRVVTYRQLVQGAAAVCDQLLAQGVGPGTVVAVAGPRGAELAAAVLGTWSAGAAYLPIDPDHPAARIHHQLDDAGCRVVLDGQLLPESCRAERICLPVPAPDAERGCAAEAAAEGGITPTVSGDALAYLIYTSGSTGSPKGVRISHRNLANVVRHFARALDVDAGAGMLWLTTFAFDISVLELCLPLVCGGRVVVAPDTARSKPEVLLDTVERGGATLIQATPTTWRLVVPAAAGRLAGRTLLCGGEPLAPALARRLHATGARAYNVYGPTETTIWSTSALLTEEELDRPTVGRPLANTRVYLLDSRGRPVPPGVSAELCIAGDGVAQGYHERPELTAERFRAGPDRYYRTGDFARMLPDGRLELLGRGDRQIKLRAHRIELGEVEAVLADHPQVRAAAVVLRGDPAGDGYLVAYLVADDRPGLAEDVWAFARAHLPAYALPSRVVVVAGLPQTPNGKVDLRALAERPADRGGGAAGAGVPADQAGDGLAADDPVQRRLVAAWRRVLGRPDLGAAANFFLVGGSSLLAVRLAEEVTAECGVPVTMGMVFRAPTPAALAALVHQAQASAPQPVGAR